MGVIDFFIALTLNCMLLFVWFNTTAFYDYLKLLGFNSFFKEYEKTPLSVMYTQYLYDNKDKITASRVGRFCLKLITCVFCLNFWTTLSICVFYSVYTYIPILYIATLLVYGVLKKIYEL